MNNSNIDIYAADQTYVIRAAGGIVAETKAALILKEGEVERVFFPKSDVAIAFFDDSESKASHPNFGQAKYFHLVGKSRTIEDTAWVYEGTSEELKAIEGYFTFDNAKVTIEAL